MCPGASPPGCLGEPGTAGLLNALFGTTGFPRILALALWYRSSKTSHWLPHTPHFPSLAPRTKISLATPLYVTNPEPPPPRTGVHRWLEKCVSAALCDCRLPVPRRGGSLGSTYTQNTVTSCPNHIVFQWSKEPKVP